MAEVPETLEDWQQAIDSYQTPMDIVWQFSYAISDNKLERLYKKSKQMQWDADEYLDWDIELDPSKPIVEQASGLLKIPLFAKMSQSQRDQFTAHSTAQLLSQFLHGEQGALMTAAALTHAVEDYDAKLFGATQTMDEARHVEVYERYINKLSIVYPLSPWLKKLIDVTLQSGSPAKIMCGMNMVVEGLALGAFHNMHKTTTCPLLKKLTEGVLADEARHVGFGNIYFSSIIKKLHPDDREDVAQFAFEAIKLQVDAQGGPDGQGPREPNPGFMMVLENCNIDPQDFFKAIMEAGAVGAFSAKLPPGHIHSFKDLMMPALVRAGAITDRTRELFKAEGIPVHDSLAVLRSMEDVSTGAVAGEIQENDDLEPNVEAARESSI